MQAGALQLLHRPQALLCRVRPGALPLMQQQALPVISRQWALPTLQPLAQQGAQPPLRQPRAWLWQGVPPTSTQEGALLMGTQQGLPPLLPRQALPANAMAAAQRRADCRGSLR